MKVQWDSATLSITGNYLHYPLSRSPIPKLRAISLFTLTIQNPARLLNDSFDIVVDQDIRSLGDCYWPLCCISKD